MWKIRIEYNDKSKMTLTGKHQDIPLRLAEKYYKECVAGKGCTARYQQYPKNKHEEMDLIMKIENLRQELRK